MIPYKDMTPSRRFPIVTVVLLAANCAVFLYEILLPEPLATKFIYQYAVVPFKFNRIHPFETSPGFFPLLSIGTGMFLHGGWLHLLGNMLYLWIFGDNVEDSFGRVRFLLFYLLCGILATLAQIYGSLHSRIPSLGASGAIAGVLAAYLRLFPRAKIAVLVPVFYFLRTVVLPAWFVLGFWMFLQIVQVQFASHSPMSEAGGIAYFAHIGGFAAGFFMTPLFVKKRRASR